VATVIAGGTLAAAGQQALGAALPAATDGANVLRLGVAEFLGASAVPAGDPAAVAGSVSAVTPVAPAAPLVADATALVKAAGLQEEARAVEQAKAAEEARAAAAKAAAAKAAAAKAAATVAGVQMIVGRVTSGFGGRWGTLHQGIDIAAPIGTPIRAPLGGTVISSGPASGFGLWVRLRHADGTITVYGHINRSLVRVGENVQAGDEIAEVGDRGESTGPHLHFGVMIDGSYVDPRPWLDRRGIRY
jgi:murein DD-endopeptidase MepM/ murein hydrolase activator NlpD